MKSLMLALLMLVLPLRLGTNELGNITLNAPYAAAKSGSGSDGDGGDNEGDDGDSDGDDGDNDGDEGDGYDGDDGESDYGDRDRDGYSHNDGSDRGRDNSTRDEVSEDKAKVVRVQRLSNGARISFSDGSKQELKDGQFSRTDARGRVVESRRARGSDIARIKSHFSQAKNGAKGTAPVINSRAVKARYRGQDIDILYANGWREQITSGRYKLTDKYGRVITHRRAVRADITRLNRFRN